MQKLTAGKKDWSLKTLLTNCEETSFIQHAVSPRYGESEYTFSAEGVASGKISTFITPCLELSRLDIHLPYNLTLQADDAIERHVSSFVLKGKITSAFGYADTDAEQQSMQHLFSHTAARGCEHTIHAGSNTVVYINLKTEWLYSFLPDWEATCSSIGWKKTARMFHLSQARDIGRNRHLRQLLDDVNENRFKGPARSLLLEARAMELLATQIDELLGTAGAETIVSKKDKEKLSALYEYISGNYLEPLSLEQMARQFTLNEFKIKKGFRQLYGESAFQYIQRLRMEQAHHWLISGEMNVSEVSDRIGYSSIHNFSNAFFKRYRYRPVKLTAANPAIPAGVCNSL